MFLLLNLLLSWFSLCTLWQQKHTLCVHFLYLAWQRYLTIMLKVLVALTSRLLSFSPMLECWLAIRKMTFYACVSTLITLSPHLQCHLENTICSCTLPCDCLHVHVHCTVHVFLRTCLCSVWGRSPRLLLAHVSIGLYYGVEPLLKELLHRNMLKIPLLCDMPSIAKHGQDEVISIFKQFESLDGNGSF